MMEATEKPPITPSPHHPITRHPSPVARELFDPAPGLVYLDAATYGLPPRPSVEVLQRALHRWQSGEADWVEEWDRTGEACRKHFAALVGAPADEIALMLSPHVYDTESDIDRAVEALNRFAA